MKNLFYSASCFYMTVIVLTELVNSFSFMVPQDSCFTLNPAHNCSKQPTESPYKIYVGSNYYHFNDEIKGIIICLIRV